MFFAFCFALSLLDFCTVMLLQAKCPNVDCESPFYSSCCIAEGCRIDVATAKFISFDCWLS